MAKKKKEEVVEKTTNEPKGKETKGDVTKVKTKMKNKPQDLDKETITKVDLSKPPKTKEDAVQERKTEEMDVEAQTGDGEKVDEGGEKPVIEEIRVQDEQPVQDEGVPVLEEVVEEEKKEVEEIAIKAEEAITESMETGKALPENIQKLMDFMEDTGGDLNDYVQLNRDYSELDNLTLLEEYYKQTKPHLDNEEISFIMEDKFAYDEDVDEDRDIKRKKLAMKEQVASARQHLDSVKSKYYEDIKSGSKLTNEQQEAIEFFNNHNEKLESDNAVRSKNKSTFLDKTNKVFNDKFKGFEYDVGDKKYRYNVNDINGVKKTQSDINNFVGKFLDKNKTMEDAEGYHKSLYTAMNSDAIAKHFYEQGKADALRDSVAKSKNIDMDPRQQLGKNIVSANGMTVKVLGDTTEDFKFKIKNNKFKN